MEVILSNLFREEFGIRTELAIFLAQWKNGEFGPNAELLPEEVRQYYFHGKGTLPKSYVRRRPNGTVLQVQIEPLPPGGMVQSYTDITELWPPRKRPRREPGPSPRSSRP